MSFNVPVLSTVLNNTSNESYYVVTSTLWTFNISVDTAFILKLPLISTALIKTRVSVPICKIPEATLIS